MPKAPGRLDDPDHANAILTELGGPRIFTQMIGLMDDFVVQVSSVFGTCARLSIESVKLGGRVQKLRTTLGQSTDSKFPLPYGSDRARFERIFVSYLVILKCIC